MISIKILTTNHSKCYKLSIILLELFRKHLSEFNWCTVGLKTKIKKVTLLRAPHAFAKSKKQYEQRIYKIALHGKWKQEVEQSTSKLTKKVESIEQILSSARNLEYKIEYNINEMHQVNKNK